MRSLLSEAIAIGGFLFVAFATSVGHAEGCDASGGGFSSPPVTRLGNIRCAPGQQQHQENELLNLEKAGSGRIIVSTIQVQIETRSEAGLVIRIGPYGTYNNSGFFLVDRDEVAAIDAYLEKAIAHSADRAAPVREIRAFVFRTQSGLELVAMRGELGGLTVSTGSRLTGYSHNVALSADETRRLQSAIRSARETLARLK